MKNNFVPNDFELPEPLETEKFNLRVLGPEYAKKDYDAVMNSIGHLRGIFGPKSKWPKRDMTLEQNKKDLEWHKNEFEKRSSFAYTVLSHDESKCLGCVYIYPSRNKKFEADVFTWVRESFLELDEYLYKKVRQWIKEEWPLENIIFPGREISWQKYKN